MNFAPGVLVANRFRLVRILGQGGMGSVWLAEHTGLDVPCAVKFIHPEAAQSPEVRARFEREAKAAAHLRSPHVVQILDHGVWEGSPYIAMELLEGEDLAARLSARGVLTPPEVATLVAQVGRALQKAHAAGLVHRDLKPANIFLVRDDDHEIAKVLDFGVAKATRVGTDGNTKTGTLLGTPYYMSPEQARGSREVDHRADLWALSVLVFEALTGRLPFFADGFGELLVKIIVEPPPVPSQVARVPPGFDAWWTRATAREVNDRFQSAKELVEALSIALGVTMPGPAVGDMGAALRNSGYGGAADSSIPSGQFAPTPATGGLPPTPLHQAISVGSVVAPRRSFTPFILLGGVLAAAALGAFVVVRSKLALGVAQPPPRAVASAAPDYSAAMGVGSAALPAKAPAVGPDPLATSVPSPPVPDAGPLGAPPAASSSSVALPPSAAPPPRSSPSRRGHDAPKALPQAPPVGRPKTDFGI